MAGLFSSIMTRTYRAGAAALVDGGSADEQAQTGDHATEARQQKQQTNNDYHGHAAHRLLNRSWHVHLLIETPG